ncbi:acylglycerol lipase [Melampsora larici-populina 98AG31]|uniref:Acylglycerol lipase n=1 Tax=Melampsora larici-populina (strain 98AG31 / pathotype 3-4-7) TaxID=747676 RepID=F4RB64_MELLP|nr:acylglycerol lipase [Melampsora larici-populina 98AG31]EGG10409.1 acylglycerol lipase [Melampsora larici-populina 98AG31]
MSFKTQVEWQEGPNQTSFYTKRWSPSNQITTIAKLIFIHGFMEHISRYDHVYSRYAEAGIEVFAFDQRGFGETAAKTKTQGQTSWPEALRDVDYFIEKEARLVSTKVFLMGHSMGGGLTYAYFTRDVPLPSSALITGGTILSSPLIQQAPGVAAPGMFVRIGSFVGAVLPKLTLKVGVASKDICRDPVIQEEYANDPLCAPIGTFKGIADMILGGQGLLDHDYVRFPESLPILAVHGTGDKVTSCKATEELMEKTNAKDKTFKTFEGYYHEMHNEPGNDKIIFMDYIIDWIKSHV